MPARRVRIDVFDTEGNRYSISFEGQVTRDKALRLLDLVELLGGMPSENNVVLPSATAENELSKYDKIRILIQRHFPVVWFSSREVQSVYEQELKEPVNLSTIATYLSRMAIKGIVLRRGSSNNLRYKTVQGATEAIIKQGAAW